MIKIKLAIDEWLPGQLSTDSTLTSNVIVASSPRHQLDYSNELMHSLPDSELLESVDSTTSQVADRPRMSVETSCAGPGAPLSARLAQIPWLVCFALVDFDLDTGPLLEHIYPPSALSAHAATALLWSSFPDSNSSRHMGDSAHAFIIRDASVAEGYLHCSVYFRMRPDPSSKRGFFQKSLVVCCAHQYMGLTARVAEIVGMRVFADLDSGGSGLATLEMAWRDIQQWQDPTSKLLYECARVYADVELALFGEILRFTLAPDSYPQMFDKRDAVRSRRTGTLQSTDKYAPANPANLYQLFHVKPKILWTLWELLITGQSIYIVGDTPTACSQVVCALVELIKPVPFGGDYRPFLAIQDADIKSLATGMGGVIVGVTNPMCVQMLAENFQFRLNVAVESIPILPTALEKRHGTYPATTLTSELKTHRNFLSSDKKLLAEIENVGVLVQGEEPINNKLYAHFIELTERFLHPLNQHFALLVTFTPDTRVPLIRPWSTADFLATIAANRTTP